MFGFLTGAIAGAMAAYFWHDRLRSYLRGEGSGIRDRAAQGLATLGERAESTLDQMKTKVESAVRTGQERLRATGTSSYEGTGSRPTESYRPGSSYPNQP